MVDKLTANRWLVGLSGVVLIAAAAVASFYVALLVGLGTCWGEGGEPYSDPASVAGRFCDGPLFSVWAFTLLLPAVVALVYLVLAVKRRAWRTLAVGALATVCALALAAVPLALPAG